MVFTSYTYCCGTLVPQWSNSFIKNNCVEQNKENNNYLLILLRVLSKSNTKRMLIYVLPTCGGRL